MDFGWIYVLEDAMRRRHSSPALTSDQPDRYVFGSLLSRNTTYRLMHHVWLKSADPDSTEDEPTASDISEPGTSDELPVPSPTAPLPLSRSDELSVRRISRRKSELFPRISLKAVRRQCSTPDSVVDQITLSKCHWDCAKGRESFAKIEESAQEVNSGLPKITLVLLVATLLLVILFMFATVLVYRVSLTHTKNGSEDNWTYKTGNRLINYLELLKEQQRAVEGEILRITTTLKNRLNELGQVRQSIDQLVGLATGVPSCKAEGQTADQPDLSILS